MAEIAIIADDLTGANATGVLFARDSYKTASFVYNSDDNEQESNDFDIISVSTESRSIEPEAAYKRVKKAAESLRTNNLKLICKRVDSTLRGNIGAEIDGVLDALPREHMAAVVPAFPSSGRINIGSYLLVNSIPLEKTGVASDPKTPVNNTFVPDIIGQQTDRSIGVISYKAVRAGRDKIREEVKAAWNSGKEIIVFDAAEDDDIEAIAAGIYSSDIPVVAVDPGPFTSCLGKRLLDVKQPGEEKILLTVGSTTEVTRNQVNYMEEQRDVYWEKVNVKKLLQPETRQKEINRCVDSIIAKINDHKLFGIISARSEDDLLTKKEVASFCNNFEQDIFEKISTGLAEIADRLLNEVDCWQGLYVSGGDTTLALVEQFSARGMQVIEEVLPLTVYGKLIGGSHEDLSFVSKGGLIGDTDAVEKCINKLS